VNISHSGCFTDPGWRYCINQGRSAGRPATLDKIEQTVCNEVAGTLLSTWPMVRVSSKTGQGIEKLKQVIADLLANHPPRPDLGKPRLSIDRVFTLSGFGVVVTALCPPVIACR